MDPRFCRGWLLAPWLVSMSLGAADVGTAIADATKNRDMKAVADLLAQRVDVNTRQPDGTTALHWAVRWDALEMVDQLIRAGANVNATNRYNITPLALACINGSAAVVEKLLQAGADLNAAPNGEPPLMLAARTGDFETVKLLLTHGAAVNAKETERGQTALMWAVAEANPTVAKLLIENGADVHARSTSGFTPLMFGVRKGDLESVRTLLAAGANPNEEVPDGSPLSFVAIVNAHYELAAFLVERGADPNGVDKTGRTALHALIDARNTVGAQFQYTRAPTQTGNLDTAGLIQALLANGANPNVRIQKLDSPAPGRNVVDAIDAGLNLNGATPFFLAAQNVDAQAMHILVAGGADPRLPTNDNSTPLMAAAGLGSRQRQGGPTPAGVLEAVRLAVELGGDVNATNVHGQTALHGAVYRGVDEVIQFLVDRGAKLDAKDKMGRTPIALAEGLDSRGRGSALREETLALLRKSAAKDAIK